MKTFRPVKNAIKIHIDFQYEYTSTWLYYKCLDFHKSTEAICCKGDALDLRHTFDIVYKQVQSLKNNRPDLISDNLISKDIVSDFNLIRWAVKFEGIVNSIPVDLKFTDMEQFLVYLAKNKLLTDYSATNLFAVYYPDNDFNHCLSQSDKVLNN